MHDEPTAREGVSRDEALMFLNDHLDRGIIAVLTVDVGQNHPAVTFSASGRLTHYGRTEREFEPARTWPDRLDGMYTIDKAHSTLTIDEHFREFRFADNGALDIGLAPGVTLRIGGPAQLVDR